MNRIKELRKTFGESQAALGKIIGVAQNTVCNWENGNRDPDNDILIAIANHFDVSIDYILYRSDFPREVPENAETPAVPEGGELDEAFLSDFNRLTDEERRLVHAQIKGIIDNRK